MQKGAQPVSFPQPVNEQGKFTSQHGKAPLSHCMVWKGCQKQTKRFGSPLRDTHMLLREQKQVPGWPEMKGFPFSAGAKVDGIAFISGNQGWKMCRWSMYDSLNYFCKCSIVRMFYQLGRSYPWYCLKHSLRQR